MKLFTLSIAALILLGEVQARLGDNLGSDVIAGISKASKRSTGKAQGGKPKKSKKAEIEKKKKSQTKVPTSNQQGSCVCGVLNGGGVKIVGGKATTVGEYPWQAALIYNRIGVIHVFCGAVIINNQFVATAAHCTQAIKDNNITYQVLIGAYSISSPSSYQMIISPTKYIQNPNYLPSAYSHDISLVQLSQTLDFNSLSVGIRPVCLPTNPTNSYSKVPATITGWGTLKSNGVQPDLLQMVGVPTMTNTKCAQHYGSTITNDMICAGLPSGGKDACQGDSGGPLVAPEGSYYVLIGLVSFGDGCALPNVPGVYTRVTSYVDWIAQEVGSATTCPPPS